MDLDALHSLVPVTPPVLVIEIDYRDYQGGGTKKQGDQRKGPEGRNLRDFCDLGFLR